MKTYSWLLTLLLLGCDNTKPQIEGAPNEETIISQIVSNSCNVAPIWDSRYHEPDYWSQCIAERLHFKSRIDLTLGYQPNVFYGGPQDTLRYDLDRPRPWADKNSLMVQIDLKEPEFNNIGGGGVNFIMYLGNKTTGELYSYVVNYYALNSSVHEHLDYDPSTDIGYVSTKAVGGEIYTTGSAFTDGDFIRFYITYENANRALTEPENWFIYFLGVQIELEEELGEGIVTTEFTNFEAYITKPKDKQ